MVGRVLGCLSIVVLVVAACGSSTVSTAPSGGAPSAGTSSASAVEPAGSSPAGSPAAPAAASGPAAWYDALPACSANATYRCGTMQVPLDDANPTGEQLTLAYYVRPHTDTTQPPLEPIVSIPGGPGYAALGASPLLPPDWLTRRHDMVLVDRRGTGGSAAIDCPDLQDGWASQAEFVAATAACGKQLGTSAARYGSGDAAIDVETLRQALGLDEISLLGFSYGSQVAEGYAARYPEHVHAMVIESGLLANDPQQRWGWDPGKPRAWIDALVLACKAQAPCLDQNPDPAKMIEQLFAKIQKAPLEATVNGEKLTADEFSVANLLGSVDEGGPNGGTFVSAVRDALAGDPDVLVQEANAQSPFPGDQGAVTDYSAGLNQAAWCDDVAIAWDRSDPIETRKAKLAAAIKALPTDAFEPVTVASWMKWAWPDSCIEWPAPDRYEPVIPAGATITVPTLILNGSVDKTTTGVQARAVHDAIPGSILATIFGADHGTTWAPGCAADLEASFLETLKADANACVSPP